MDGQKIEHLRTLKSMYDNNCIEATVGNKYYRIDVHEFLKIINGVKFKKVKKRVHTYLIIEEVNNGRFFIN